MKSKYVILISIIIISLPLLFTSCSKVVKPNTPQNAAWCAKNFLDAGNYGEFKQLFAAGRKNTLSEEQFTELKKLTASGTEYVNYQLLKFSNGKMMLIMLTPDKVDGAYKIQDIKEVPEDMKTLFELK